tara:strand:+ start:34 stop:345 length:312 start_codon:yes stop_codon:yes gene_type:complete
MNWNELKLEVLNDLKNANVEGEAARTILNFERRVNTCRNMLHRGSTWETMTYTKAFTDARELLDSLNENGEWGMKEAKFYPEFERYCTARGLGAGFNLGDCCC